MIGKIYYEKKKTIDELNNKINSITPAPVDLGRNPPIDINKTVGEWTCTFDADQFVIMMKESSLKNIFHKDDIQYLKITQERFVGFDYVQKIETYFLHFNPPTVYTFYRYGYEYHRVTRGWYWTRFEPVNDVEIYSYSSEPSITLNKIIRFNDLANNIYQKYKTIYIQLININEISIGQNKIIAKPNVTLILSGTGVRFWNLDIFVNYTELFRCVYDYSNDLVSELKLITF